MGLLVWAVIIIAVVVYFVVPDVPDLNVLTRPFQSISSRKPYSKRTGTSGPEEMCRDILEEIFERPFPSVRPDWLKYHTGKNLELDCYNQELKLAIEYNGKQHYTYTDHFHRGNSDNFVSQVERDEFKKKACADRDITLISVPYTVPNYMLKSYLVKKLRKHSYVT
jgi:hypothetical protein